MKKYYFSLIMITAIFAEVTAQAQMTMTTQKKGKVEIGLGGSGLITIDWGDGSERITDKLSEWNSHYHHIYADTIIRTITVIGKNITDFFCDRNELTSLDVKKIKNCYSYVALIIV